MTPDAFRRLYDEALQRPVGPRLAAWEALWHVLNHGTDHRAQTLVILAQLGAPTFAQDYAIYVDERR